MNKILFKPDSLKILKGDCYFCGTSVYANEGQLVTYLKKLNGEKRELSPTHKICRKENKI